MHSVRRQFTAIVGLVLWCISTTLTNVGLLQALGALMSLLPIEPNAFISLAVSLPITAVQVYFLYQRAMQFRDEIGGDRAGADVGVRARDLAGVAADVILWIWEKFDK